MNNIKIFIDQLEKSPLEYVGMDNSHYMNILGTLLASKPDQVLEVGIGTGMLTAGLIMGLRYNQKGSLTCVDNWFDWKGVEPPEISILRDSGVTVIAPVDEQIFLKSCPADSYDFVVSDGDHRNIAKWVDEYFRITRNGGIIYFHDSNNVELFPTINRIEQRVRELDLPHFHFKHSSRPDERCERGLLMVINRK